jgi:histidyl-tRNA synthetase
VERLGLAKSACLEINSIGTAQDRAHYMERLKAYFQQMYDRLSEESRERIERNPLRILDSKAPEDQEVSENAPRLLDHVSQETREKFDFVCRLLDEMHIPYRTNWRLVRGLDYYNDTVWEIKYQASQLGLSQDTILAGGRYDHLVETMDERYRVPAVG